MAAKGTRVTQKEKEKMWQLFQDGNSFVKIGKKLRRNPDTVSRYVREYEAAVSAAGYVLNVKMEMSRNVQSGNTQNLKSTVIQRSVPRWSVAERRRTAAASDQAAVCACAHSRYFTGGRPSGLRV